MTERFEGDELVRAIREIEAPRARAAFRTGLRSALVTTAAKEWRAPRASQPPRFRLAFAPRLVLTAAVILAVAVGGTGAAAASSLPGDTAYGVKLALEQVELALAQDDVARVQVLGRQADRRLDELKRVAALRPDMEAVATISYRMTVDRLQAAVDALKVAPADEKSERALEVADAAAQKHVEELEAIKAKSDSPEIHRALEKAKELERHTDKDQRRQDQMNEDKKKHDDRKKDDDKKKGENRDNPEMGPWILTPSNTSPARETRPAETVRPTTKPAETPKPGDESKHRDD